MLRRPGKSRAGADIDVEEEPENYQQIWETSVFCLGRVNRKKKPQSVLWKLSKKTKQNQIKPNKKAQTPITQHEMRKCGVQF